MELKVFRWFSSFVLATYHYHRENVTEKWYGERLKIKAIKFLIEKGYDVPIY